MLKTILPLALLFLAAQIAPAQDNAKLILGKWKCERLDFPALDKLQSELAEKAETSGDDDEKVSLAMTMYLTELLKETFDSAVFEFLPKGKGSTAHLNQKTGAMKAVPMTYKFGAGKKSILLAQQEVEDEYVIRELNETSLILFRAKDGVEMTLYFTRVN